ncbi:hypothetical protein HDU79_007376 [Rhizoclosmatium sp. JEL0117]|nr:hypothetical protein HDU79_007376 [Rhizoclosmatium sp. JEL0117]
MEDTILHFDILVLILGWIPPKVALPLARVCSAFNNVIQSSAYAIQAMQNLCEPGNPFMNKPELIPTDFDLLFINGPPSVADAYVRHRMQHYTHFWFNAFLLSSVKAKRRGPFPVALCSLTNLSILELSCGDRIGTVPFEIGQLINLERLDLSKNSEMTGPLPDSIADLAALKVLKISNTSINGPLPKGLSRLSNLEKIYAFNTSITGPLPSFDNLVNLVMLHMGNSLLTGTIPASLACCCNLRRIILNNNSLVGEIPSSLGRLEQLTHLNLENNSLQGVLPHELDNLSLFELKLGGNPELIHKEPGLAPLELTNPVMP